MAVRTNAGFTLIEVLLAVTITSVVMVTVATTFHVMLNARDVVDDLAESTEAGPRILNLIERDLRGLWTYNVKNNAVFRGRDMDVAGRDADRMDFLTTTDAVGYVLDLQNVPRKPTVCEVGYWFKQNPRYRDVFEMWRREDPMLDDDLITQGSFQLVHDRVKSFKVTYYRTLGYEAQPELQWDSALEDKLPKRIQVEFTIERKRSSRNVVSDVEIDDFEGAEKTYVRHFVFDNQFDDVLAANSARLPVFPPEPVPQEAGGGPAGPG
ncbi:MAG: prepilin-type N-terminal cleavage/methylation domain-containing protein, partial [Planctomycetota bacterium]